MNLYRRAVSLLFGLLLLAASSHAQTALGQPTLDEQKVQIWCATIKFVYDDTGRPNLKNSLQCGGSLKALENSIKADSQRVYSALYQPLEGRGVMYKGLGSDKSRVQKLATEIINRLKSSPARRSNPARMQAVEALAAQLTGYVQNGTPPTEVAATAAEAAPDTTMTEETAAPVSEELTADNTVAAAPARSGSGESLMSKFFAPLALIVSLLSLFLYVLMRRSLDGFQKELSSRIDKRREEIQALQTSPGVGGSSASARLTPELRQQIELLVQQRVAEELSKRPATPVATAAPPRQNSNQNQRPNTGQNQPQGRPVEKPRPAPAPVPQSAPAPAPVAEAPAPVVTPFANISEAPSAYEAPTAQTNTPVTNDSDEFNSLVPPVQLPAPERPVAPVPALRYVKVPVNGGFSEYDLSDQPQHDSIYQISLNPQNPDMATFRVNPNPAVHAYAIQSAQYSLREACRYQQPSGAVSRIVTEEDGTLRRVGSAWQIEQKAGIRFE
ncbi:hypothetical protein FY528_03325 [Hymenobacter lutimineralis]|uniref:Uncharacterized protein n=1 Tax=Hymenobacter lutimineralis TaxID=2606448 RepID=A0A5D6VBT9_9BACT|nr:MULTISPECIES: hypothetical protein [Hymenobacter]QIX61233.1 hypothetical protein HER32_08605 [Hymenobacter sp. BT18]TYZ13451.1 hypothetical protein FY528_03325 [Hymenobacter lutimineralis]